jgi:serine phosphatase RsbU (regulator of sigma subunit)
VSAGARVTLRQVLGRDAETRGLVTRLVESLGGPVAVQDSDGRLLFGEANGAPISRHPVQLGDASLGDVAGGGAAAAVAGVLAHLAAKEAERKALGAEVLNLYRELNLIYGFSEKLAALLDVERVAALTLQEARHLIVATDGVVMLLDDAGETLHTVAGFGDELPAFGAFARGVGIIGSIAASGAAEIINDVDADPRRITERTPIKALLVAPLRVGERVTGVIALASTMPMAYTAAELKLLNTLALQTATAIENARLFERTVQAARERERLLALQQETELARARLANELELAAQIQANLFPSPLPHVDGYTLAAHNRPARRCGGDYYDAIATSAADGGARLLLCVADVSGKGLPASLVMSNMQATLRALLGRTPSLPALADHASALLFAATTPEKYVTAAFVEIEPATGAMKFVGAGHVDTLVVRRGGEAVTLVSTGTPLGLLQPGLPFGESELTLEPGDVLVLYSDGVTEAQNAGYEEFGLDRLLDVVRAHAAEPPATLIARVLEAIDRFAGDAPQFDDITLLVATRQAIPNA